MADGAGHLSDREKEAADCGVGELPQKPFVAHAADDQQIQPVGDGVITQRWCRGLTTIALKSILGTLPPFSAPEMAASSTCTCREWQQGKKQCKIVFWIQTRQVSKAIAQRFQNVRCHNLGHGCDALHDNDVKEMSLRSNG